MVGKRSWIKRRTVQYVHGGETQLGFPNIAPSDSLKARYMHLDPFDSLFQRDSLGPSVISSSSYVIAVASFDDQLRRMCEEHYT